MTVADYGPQRVAFGAVLERPGLVILADVDDPGWRLTIDRRRAGPDLPRRHRLVYTYEPRSLRIGGRIGLAAWIVLGLWSSRRPFSAALVGDRMGELRR